MEEEKEEEEEEVRANAVGAHIERNMGHVLRIDPPDGTKHFEKKQRKTLHR